MAKKMKSKVEFFNLDKEVAKQHFRVAIFGSARIKPNNKDYKEVVELGKFLGEKGIDVVTGGGPGIMEAACKGHELGRKKFKNHSHAFGLTIRLPKEQHDNKHFDMKKDFIKFSSRLDNFIQLSDAVVVATGGVGTLLEFLYTWQLVQVEHIYDIPIILLGDQWPPLIEWVKKGPLKNKLLNPEDLHPLYTVKSAKEAYKLIHLVHEAYKKNKNHNHLASSSFPK
ncbi:LOG family protein [Candidatus Woesearchaeota archaeon]|nr:LOG family protein [Candidatus Woesearchaeota archaeon]